MPACAAPDTQIVSLDAPGPFAGLTVSQAEILNDVCAGLLVQVAGGRHNTAPDLYVFERILLPGMYATDPLQAVGDLILTRVDAQHKPVAGVRRVLSVALVRDFQVRSRDPHRYCSQCHAALDRTDKVHDLSALGRQREGLVPQQAAKGRGSQAKRQPAGIYVFCDREVADRARPVIESAKGPCDLWQIDMDDVTEVVRDRGYATESLIVMHPVAARWVP